MRTLVFTCIFLIIQLVCCAQSLSELQSRKLKAVEEIEFTTRLLDEALKSEKASLNRLQLLNSQINQRNNIISGINDEIRLYQNLINENTLSISRLTGEMQKIRNEYAELIRSAYRSRTATDKIIYFLSAEDFNQAYRRYIYMRQYTSYRKKQAETIDSIQSVLREQTAGLERQRQTRQDLINENRKEAQKLETEKKQQNQEVQSLQKQQQTLTQRLNQQRREEQQIENEIQKIIEEEARKSRATGETGFALTPEQKLTGANFEQNKNSLPWPVERGIVTERFGINTHPILSNVQIRNNGINISTETGARVRAVFNGEVTRVFGITGGNTAVIIRHGNYLTVYSNLREVVVKMGDKVDTKQTIGTVFTDAADGNKSILKFQIWRESQKLNPEEWIVK